MTWHDGPTADTHRYWLLDGQYVFGWTNDPIQAASWLALPGKSVIDRALPPYEPKVVA